MFYVEHSSLDCVIIISVDATVYHHQHHHFYYVFLYYCIYCLNDLYCLEAPTALTLVAGVNCADALRNGPFFALQFFTSMAVNVSGASSIAT